MLNRRHGLHARRFQSRQERGERGGTREDGSTATRDASGSIHDHFFGQSSFGTFALVHERNVIKGPKNAPLELLGPLGCGIQTGAGAVMNALRVSPGSSFTAFGGGAVGNVPRASTQFAGCQFFGAV